ncbi:MAG: cytochrome c3 family protein [Acidobacteriota bacterium]
MVINKIKYFLIFFISFFLIFINPILPQKKDSCVDCHSQLERNLSLPVKEMEADIHRERGFSCFTCHGGDPALDDESSMDEKKGFLGKLNKKKILSLCSGCHSNPDFMKKFNPSLRVDQAELYASSQHGKLLASDDDKVAVCSDCHKPHGILPSNNPKSSIFPVNVPETCGICHSNSKYMEEYKIPVDQLDTFRKSVHGVALFEKRDLGAPACNDCHGNHGSTPPQVTSVANVCRQCHGSAGELFSESPHKKAFDEMGLSECEACHGNHEISKPTDEMLGTGEGAVCVKCHEVNSRGYNVAFKMKQSIDELKNKERKAKEILRKAEKAGVEVGEAIFSLNDVNTSITKARNLIHGLDMTRIEETIKDGSAIADKAYKDGEKAIEEASFRRKGLGVSLIFIILFIVSLLYKIRQIEKRKIQRGK